MKQFGLRKQDAPSVPRHPEEVDRTQMPDEADSAPLGQGRAALLQGHEVAGFVVGHTVEPAAVKDADPLERKGAQGGLVACTASSLGFVVGHAAQNS